MKKQTPSPKRGSCDPMKSKDGSCVLKGYLGTQGLASEISRRKGMEKTASASMKKRENPYLSPAYLMADKKGNLPKIKK